MARIRTYSVYNHASGAYMHITATSKKHVRTYLREKGWDIYCDKDINMLNNWIILVKIITLRLFVYL